MKFTKFSNPRKRNRVRKDYTDRSIDAVTAMLIDQRLGYQVPAETYARKEAQR